MSYTKLSKKMKKLGNNYAKFAYDCTKFTMVASCYAIVAMPIACAYMYDVSALWFGVGDESESDSDSDEKKDTECGVNDD